MSTSATAYVKGGRLVIVGVDESEVGPIPFAYHTAVAEGTPEGPVDMGDESSLKGELDKAQRPIMNMVVREKMKLGAESLVERARAGDQNAMGMIHQIKVAAGRGSGKAKQSLRFLIQYVRTHPITETITGRRTAVFASEPNKAVLRSITRVARTRDVQRYASSVCMWVPAISGDLYVVALILADGPLLTKTRIGVIVQCLNEEDTELFLFGLRNCCRGRQLKNGMQQASPQARKIILTGHAIGLAQTIQGIRRGAFPISRLNRVAGWELGE